MDKLKEVKYIEMPNTKRERNYLKDMTLADARLWFRYRCQIIDNINRNKSSMCKHDMGCRLCNETQDHLDTYAGVAISARDKSVGAVIDDYPP